MNKIEIQDLHKSFGQQEVLKGINLTFEANTIYALLGRNGVGKSTLMRLIANQALPSRGVITDENGTSLQDNEGLLNDVYLASTIALYPAGVTIDWVLTTTAHFFAEFDMANAKRLVAKFALDPQSKVTKLSTGQRTLLQVLVALNVPCQFIFLDEPVLGLDAPNREAVYDELLAAYNQHPRTFVIATHLIEEIANLINHVVVIADGQVLLDQDSNVLAQQSRTVSGATSAVDAYLVGHARLRTEHHGNTSTAILVNGLPDDPIPDDVRAQALPLQKLFIALTTGGDSNA
ncbi:ABC transporter ATP-binding protein [Lacticaseibacillus pabuli]|uniref:ABC transporter ATP-binding protein n=1 Tax=Lacticaseibacillus pabuli TaxID=3025672 RepID=A0ABY7WTD1_9LACO|nr:ABC transporter ATP-binding protein [Lacticaseibacillus sp. KACC 23028]WDF83415.1 ABC transporter ATP-binding protein [Lacticaseibacillus sp. KACC 23028]